MAVINLHHLTGHDLPVPEATRLSSHTYEWLDLERGSRGG